MTAPRATEGVITVAGTESVSTTNPLATAGATIDVTLSTASTGRIVATLGGSTLHAATATPGETEIGVAVTVGATTAAPTTIASGNKIVTTVGGTTLDTT